jgi:DEAD/DEAH box helicase domain-containing protein
VGSKPDFVFWPWQSGTLRKPVAVFCDGWQYHQNSLREDANKRSALVLSGRYWVWSVTHDDVKTALDGNIQTDLESPANTLRRHDGAGVPVNVPRSVGGAFSNHAVAQLLSFLGTPAGSGVQDEGMSQIQRNVLWLNFLMVPNTQEEKALVESKMSRWLPQLPENMQAPQVGFAPVLSKGNAAPMVLGWWPTTYARGTREGLTAPGVVLLEDVDCPDTEALRLNWRKWLALFNQEQMLPGMLLATRSAMDAGDCAGWSPSRQGDTRTGASSSDQQVLAKDWTDAIEQALAAIQPGLCELALLQVQAPLMGHELANDRHQVVAEAEMAWPSSLLVVLTADQEDMGHDWADAGWTVLVLSEDYLTIATKTWVQAVVEKLNMNTSSVGAE